MTDYWTSTNTVRPLKPSKKEITPARRAVDVANNMLTKHRKMQLFDIFKSLPRDVDFVATARIIDPSLTIETLNDIHETFTIFQTEA